LPIILWIIAHNIWFFIIAAALNSFVMITITAWKCLLVEDTAPKERHKVFMMLQFLTLACGLAAPLGGLMVSQWSLIPAVQLMYAFGFAAMLAKTIIRAYMLKETEIGFRKKSAYLKVR